MTDQPAGSAPDLSICIVTLNASSYLRGCLTSLRQNTRQASYELIVVDNGSTDGTAGLLASEFPEVKLIQNVENMGYTRPMNQALRAGRGRCLAQLNADTLVHPGAFDTLLAYLDEHPDAGICGPKVLNRDGSLQLQCRRSAARPWDVITYFTGLWKLFPRSPLFGRYLLTYLDEDQVNMVEAVSGSCMLIRREVIEAIGWLDEAFFAYQEDTDFCFRARQAGWKVFLRSPGAHHPLRRAGRLRPPALPRDLSLASLLPDLLPQAPGARLFFPGQLADVRRHGAQAGHGVGRQPAAAGKSGGHAQTLSPQPNPGQFRLNRTHTKPTGPAGG